MEESAELSVDEPVVERERSGLRLRVVRHLEVGAQRRLSFGGKLAVEEVSHRALQDVVDAGGLNALEDRLRVDVARALGTALAGDGGGEVESLEEAGGRDPRPPAVPALHRGRVEEVLAHPGHQRPHRPRGDGTAQRADGTDDVLRWALDLRAPCLRRGERLGEEERAEHLPDASPAVVPGLKQWLEGLPWRIVVSEEGEELLTDPLPRRGMLGEDPENIRAVEPAVSA